MSSTHVTIAKPMERSTVKLCNVSEETGIALNVAFSKGMEEESENNHVLISLYWSEKMRINLTIINLTKINLTTIHEEDV